MDGTTSSVITACRSVIFELPPKGTPLHDRYRAQGDFSENRARLEMSALVIHTLNYWAQVPPAQGDPYCAQFAGVLFRHVEKWFDDQSLGQHIAGLVNDRDRFYNEAQQADGNRGKIEVLNALLGYATQTKIPFTAYFGKVRYQAFVDKAEQRSKESCRYFTRFQRRYIRS
jgi:hypothetical protein